MALPFGCMQNTYKNTHFHLTLKAPRKKCIWKCRLLLSSAAIFCKHYLTKLSIETNSVDPDQTAPIGAVWSESTLFVEKASKTFQQTTKAADFCCDWRLRVKTYCVALIGSVSVRFRKWVAQLTCSCLRTFVKVSLNM